jgi:hypothetical protein
MIMQGFNNHSVAIWIKNNSLKNHFSILYFMQNVMQLFYSPVTHV